MLLSIIEMQSIVTELVAHFRFSLPTPEVAIKRAPTGVTMAPMITGNEGVKIAMPLRVSLVEK